MKITSFLSTKALFPVRLLESGLFFSRDESSQQELSPPAMASELVCTRVCWTCPDMFKHSLAQSWNAQLLVTQSSSIITKIEAYIFRSHLADVVAKVERGKAIGLRSSSLLVTKWRLFQTSWHPDKYSFHFRFLPVLSRWWYTEITWKRWYVQKTASNIIYLIPTSTELNSESYMCGMSPSPRWQYSQLEKIA